MDLQVNITVLIISFLGTSLTPILQSSGYPTTTKQLAQLEEKGRSFFTSMRLARRGMAQSGQGVGTELYIIIRHSAKD